MGYKNVVNSRENNSIASVFPLRFEHSDFKVDDFVVECPECGGTHGLSSITGSVSQPMDSMYVLQGSSLCEHCGNSEPVFIRFHQDHRVTTLTRFGWKAFSFEEEKRQSLIERLQTFFGLARG